MSASVASGFETPRPSHRGGAKKAAIVVAKLLVTGACFWYISRQIDWHQVSSAVRLLDFRWAALATFIAVLLIPLASLRWSNIVDSLEAHDQHFPFAPMVAATAVGLFFAQVLPNVAGEGIRAWLLVRLGSDWRTAVTIHALTIVIVWLVGRAQGLALPLADAAILFTVMIGVVIVPISISGWGLRELAVVSLLATYGVAPERALLFSVCFGLALAVGSLPGALAWLFYPFASARRSAECGG